MNNAKRIKDSLDICIKEISESKELYCVNPNRDFTRNKKLSFSEVLKTILCFTSKSLNNEMIEFFGCNPDMASTSAFVQQRAKIMSSAFETLFKVFTGQISKIQLHNGYRLFAVDGSDLHTPTNKDDKDSLFQNEDRAPYNLYHLNALYDLLTNTYVDAVVQKSRLQNENEALCLMVDRFESKHPTIFTADRGFESFNNMAHIQQAGQFFLIRIKDRKSNGLLRGFDLPNCDEFDLSFDLHLTRKQTNEVKELLKDRNHYRLIPSKSPFDFLPAKSKKSDPLVFFDLMLRLVRFEISPGKYEVVATNLDSDQFPPENLKALYSMRWGIETSFRSLKYTIGLLHFHSKKPEHILQEIFAKLTMYNFTELIVSSISIHKAKRKHPYKINFSAAAIVCRKFFIGLCAPCNVETVIKKHILPIRSNRSNPRNLRSKAAVSFIYRVA